MTEAELRKQIRDLLDETEGMMSSLGLRKELWQLVGDPRDHRTSTYTERVDAMAAEFHSARRLALRAVRRYGESSKYATYFAEVAKGCWSLTCLRAAGILHRAHIVAVVDVRRHEMRLRGVTETLPSFA